MLSKARLFLPLSSNQIAAEGEWQLLQIVTSQQGRRITDQQAIWLDKLAGDGQIERMINWNFFQDSNSREAELAGVWGAIVGSFWTMLVTFLLAFPVGVMAAIYLEEFAPKNAITDFIEVNINNLAAVPSIVFGLLGLAVFVGFFGVPRSTALAGGIVLALMTLPTIIIASRAAIKAVPPSIRQAALGVGASKVQTVSHHVLPLAMPGILTGTIIGMAQALGETAPSADDRHVRVHPGNPNRNHRAGHRNTSSDLPMVGLSRTPVRDEDGSGNRGPIRSFSSL